MKKQQLSQLERLEKKSFSLNADARFKHWLSIHYPEKNLQLFDYMEIMKHVPPEFQECCLNHTLAILAEMKRHASATKFDRHKDCV